MEKKAKKGIDMGHLDPGKGMEFDIEIPVKYVEEAKRRGETTLKIEMEYEDQEGNSHSQKFELDLSTGEVKEVMDARDLDNKNCNEKRHALDIKCTDMSRIMRKR